MAVVTNADEVLHPLTVDEYLLLYEDKVFEDGVHFELLDGAVIQMSAEGVPHVAAVSRLTEHVIRGLSDPALAVTPHAPLALRPHSMPEPDLAVIDASLLGRVYAEDAYLLVEVAHTSLRKDLNRKAAIYARHGLREYWVVDVAARLVHVHTEPGPDGYGSVRQVAAPEQLRPSGVDIPPLDLAALFA